MSIDPPIVPSPPPPAARRLACGRCGATFDCRPAGGCWCADESVRLPLPADAADDCVCPACLRALAGRT